MTQLKVLALVTDAYGGYGGIAQYNRDFLSALADMDEIQSVHVLPRQVVDDEKVFQIIGPSFQTIVGGFLGLITGIKIGMDSNEQ